jgi:hypothetical protein
MIKYELRIRPNLVLARFYINFHDFIFCLSLIFFYEMELILCPHE